MSKNTKQQLRNRRHARVRALIKGTAERPRLNVFRSLTGVFVQLIDDVNNVTLVSVNSKTDKVEGDAGEREKKVKSAYLLGKLIAEKAKVKNIEYAVFDRGGYKYHGRVKAIAEGARAGGLIF